MDSVVGMSNRAGLLIQQGSLRQAIRLLRQAQVELATAAYDEKRSHQVERRDSSQGERSNDFVMFDCTGSSRDAEDKLQAMSSETNEKHFYLDSTIRSQRPSSEAKPVSAPSQQRRSMELFSNFSKEPARDDCFIYSRPVLLPKLPSCRGYQIVSVVLLFNTALAYQLLSQRMKPSFKSRLLNQALKLYQLAFLIKNRARLHFDTTFVLALVNNTAHIQSSLGRANQAEKLQKLMMSTLMMASLNGQSSLIDEMDGFFATATNAAGQSQGSGGRTAVAA